MQILHHKLGTQNRGTGKSRHAQKSLVKKRKHKSYGKADACRNR